MDATVVSQFVGKGPPREGAYRKISGGPLYEAGDVLKLLDLDSPAAETWTQKCRWDLLDWGLEKGDACELVRIAVNSQPLYRSEWCLQRANGPWAACDAYLVPCPGWIPHVPTDDDMKFYVKFAIARTGEKLLLVSCHPSDDRRQEK